MPVIALTVAVLATGCGAASPQNASGPPHATIQTSTAGTPHGTTGAPNAAGQSRATGGAADHCRATGHRQIAGLRLTRACAGCAPFRRADSAIADSHHVRDHGCGTAGPIPVRARDGNRDTSQDDQGHLRPGGRAVAALPVSELGEPDLGPSRPVPARLGPDPAAHTAGPVHRLDLPHWHGIADASGPGKWHRLPSAALADPTWLAIVDFRPAYYVDLRIYFSS